MSVVLTRMLHMLNSSHIKRSSRDCNQTHPPIILKGKPKVRESEGVSSATAVFCVKFEEQRSVVFA